MKLTAKKIILLASLFLLITGCKKNFVISEKQAVLFQLEYVNYAWDYEHNGFIIDNDGNVHTYNNPENWSFPDNSFNVSESQISSNLSKCEITGNIIPEDELKKYTSYISNIASSKVTAVKNASEDAGTLEFICYRFSEASNTYQGYIIKMEGDFTCENLNFYSKKVVAWMRDIGNSISEN